MKQRFETLDTFRGLVILNMIAYHFLYDVFVIFGKDPRWYQHSVVFAWQQFICCSFIILSGFVWPYGKKKNFKRGIFVNLLGFVITAFTLLFTPQEAIWFGILNFLGCAILLISQLHLSMTNAKTDYTHTPPAVLHLSDCGWGCFVVLDYFYSFEIFNIDI